MRHARTGNTISNDADGPGGRIARSLAFDGENRPATITDDNGSAITFLYWPDGTRAAKIGVVPTWYFSGDVAETADSLAVYGSSTLTVHHAGQLQEEISATGSRLIFRVQDGQGSTRMSLAETGTLTTGHDFGPYGAPRQANGAVVTNGKG